MTTVAGSPVMAQQPDQEWDVTKPRGQTREIDFTTQEGTWMGVDISPDGRWRRSLDGGVLPGAERSVECRVAQGTCPSLVVAA